MYKRNDLSYFFVISEVNFIKDKKVSILLYLWTLAHSNRNLEEDHSYLYNFFSKNISKYIELSRQTLSSKINYMVNKNIYSIVKTEETNILKIADCSNFNFVIINRELMNILLENRCENLCRLMIILIRSAYIQNNINGIRITQEKLCEYIGISKTNIQALNNIINKAVELNLITIDYYRTATGYRANKYNINSFYSYNK